MDKKTVVSSKSVSEALNFEEMMIFNLLLNKVKEYESKKQIQRQQEEQSLVVLIELNNQLAKALNKEHYENEDEEEEDLLDTIPQFRKQGLGKSLDQIFAQSVIEDVALGSIISQILKK